MTSQYDDAELRAIEFIRATIAGDPDATVDVATRADSQPGGTFALLQALAAFGASDVKLRAEEQGISPDQWLDQWALHKLQQHQLDADWPDEA